MKKLLTVSHVVLVKIHNAKQLMKIGDVFTASPAKQRRPSVMAGFMSNFGTGIPDAYVIVNGIRNLSATEKGSECYSTAKTAVVAGSCDPEWEEEVRVSMVGSGFLSLNVFSKSVMSEDIFLGQAQLDLRDYQAALLTGKIIRLDAPVSFGIHKVFNEVGTEIEVPDVEPQGTISISINVPSIYYNMCGGFYHIRTVLFSVSGQQIWVVLCHDTLYIYDTQYESVLIRKLSRSDIESVVEVEIDKLEIVMPGIQIKLRDGELLEWAWGSDSQKHKHMWIRALRITGHPMKI